MAAITRSRLALAIGLGLWLAASATGMAVLLQYGATPGTPGEPPVRWPETSTLEPDAGRQTLLVFAHPHCPCTRATIEELDRLLASVATRPHVQVLFAKPDGMGPDWDHTDLWQRAAAIPGVSVSRDDGGREAERFGAATSGQVLLYDVAGRLRFAGGITRSRGEIGDNDGRSMLGELLESRDAIEHTTPVFGCALREASR